MVRYPKKNNTYVPAATITVNKPVTVIESKSEALAGENAQVKLLNDHIRELEDKLKAIESSQKKQRIFLFSKWYWFYLMAVVIIYPLYMAYDYWNNLPYTATMGFYVQDKDLKELKLDTSVTYNAQEKILRLAHTMRNVTIENNPTLPGFVINAKGHNVQEARKYVLALMAAFTKEYKDQRQSKIKLALSNIENQIYERQNRIEKIITQIDTYQPQEQCMLVGLGVKKKLDNIAIVKAPELEQEFSRIKGLNRQFVLPVLKKIKIFDLITLKASLARLTDMELKKYLVNNDGLPDYEGGMSLAKSKIVAIINAYFATDNTVDPNVLIKTIFLKAKFEALDCLLNKRYGPQGSFSGRIAEYSSLKAEFDKKYLEMEDLIVMKGQLNNVLSQDLTAEIIVDKPLIVVKK